MKVYDNYKDNVRLLLDILADALDPDNANTKPETYEMAVCEALERIGDNVSADQLLPKVTTTQNGKILKVTSGKWATGNAPTGLPAVSASDNGKTMVVANGSWTKGLMNLSVGVSAGTLDTTWKAIKDAYDAGAAIFLDSAGTRAYLVSVVESSETYSVTFGEDSYTTDSETGYPAEESAAAEQ